MAAAPTPPLRTTTQSLVLWIAVLGSFVSFLDGTVVTVALPAIVEELGGGITTQQWTVDAYMLTLGSLILVAGSISDSFGRLRVLRAGLIGFGVTSVIIALAPSAPILIAARFAQGAAGALLVPSSLALIMTHFRGPAQGRAIGTWTGATSAAMVVGPLIGGLFVDLASWRLAFLINVVPIAVTLWLLARLSRQDDARDVRRPDAHVDLISAALAALGLGGVVAALIEQPNLGWTDPRILALGTTGVALLAMFLVRQTRVPDPMLPLPLFRTGNVAWGNGATFLVYGALSLNGFALGVYLQEGAGLPATAAGLASLPITLILMATSSRVGALAGRHGPRLFMTVGPLVMAVGALLMLMLAEDFDYWTQVLPGVLVFGVGLALTVSPLTSAILGAVDPSRSGIASAVNNAVSRIAGLITVALIGTIVGGSLDLAGFHRTAVVTAALLAAGGLVSWIGIRNPAASEQTSPERPPRASE
ncbi:MFS transporter [Demequina zhanjiangensis]|uniref:MFS transporter n=1 Tax=Demequina zhanjiangensis TaxID=3051659 RepID=A0ABT8G3E3_9MICO|nr:MFS transporter [Demequina sp. SYSU T00b26]MDN4473439.1 MFS transporter [Demequina sp. SYSU T00b26]